ncbi:hypothetical protein VCHE48_1152 [Vibrio cholerae HE48]|nr:hypothetical protein VCHE48_1152 [Vibrio cholerae HE48]
MAFYNPSQVADELAWLTERKRMEINGVFALIVQKLIK